MTRLSWQKNWQPRCCQEGARTHRKLKIPKLQVNSKFFSEICWKHDTLLQLLGIHYSSAFYSILGFLSYILVPFPDSNNFSSHVQFSCIMVRLSQETFFAVAGDSFQWKMNLCSILCRSVSSSFSFLSVLRDYVKIWF